MKVLVTGAGGFCGRHLSRYLQEEDIEVHAISSKDLSKPYHHYVPDVTDVRALAEALSSMKPDYIFHLAGVSHSPDPTLFYRINAEFAVGLLEALRTVGLDKCPILLTGTSAEYGMVSTEDLPILEDFPPRPYNHYGISKLAQTLAGFSASREGLPVVVVRPFNIIGPGMPVHYVIQSFALQIAKILKGELPPVIEVGNLKSSRDFVAVEDVVKVYWKLIRSPSAYGEVVNVCTGRSTVIETLLTKLIELAGIKIDVKIDPLRLKAVDVPEHYGSIEKLERMIGNIPITNLDEALSHILEAVK
jgi:GDP-4-dehydro-6-deoxy-D-mannose reductase